MFCTTECWNCEDKNCEHYISKQELFFDNQLLKSVLDEIRKYLDEFIIYIDEDGEVYFKEEFRTEYNDLLEILDKVENL